VTTTERRTAMTFFSKADAPLLDDDGIMTYAPVAIDKEVYSTVDLAQLNDGQRVTVLFKGEGPNGFSLVHARFEPGFRLPRHSHSADCLYYVVAGEAHLGSRVLKAGDGFFIDAEAPYTYSAGPDGVEVLEFRTATTFDIKIRDTTVEAWRPVIEALTANHDQWVSA
jgi:quercetin dioxygenase-like cupin family protein